MPKLSIITINLNNAEGLQKTINSVINQSFIDFEFIIIDGGSTDNSVKIIKEFENKISYWISEPDNGIYNGMNKGIKQAKGDYCFFLNSGDWLIDNKKLEFLFSKNLKEEIIYFNINTTEGTIEYPKDLTFSFFFKGTIAHQATIIKRSTLLEYGYYNESLSFVADWELYCKAYISNNKFRKINTVLCFYDLTGVSARNQDLLRIERLSVLNNTIPKFYSDYVELAFYEQSMIIQLVKKILQSNIYRWLRPPQYIIKE